jgi:hypothetical protein
LNHVQDVVRQMCERVRLEDAGGVAPLFCLCESVDGVTVSRALPDDDPVIPLVASWSARGLSAARLVLRVHLWMKRLPQAAQKDPVLEHLLFVDAVYNVVAGVSPIGRAEVSKLAALQVQAKFGDHDPSRHVAGFLVSQLRALVPRRFVDAMAATEWEEAILLAHRMLPPKRQRHPELGYVETLAAHDWFGVEYYYASQSFHVDASVPGPPRRLLVGVGCAGITLSEVSSKKRVDHLSLAELYRWGFKRGETFYWELKPAFSRPYGSTVPPSVSKGALFQVATREGRDASDQLTKYAMQVLHEIRAARAARASEPAPETRSATRIAAVWRGHRARKQLRQRAAVVMIQALARGYKARKVFEKMLDELEAQLAE